MGGIPTTYDQIFSRVAGSVPMQLLKSIDWHESAFDPKAKPPVGKDGKPVSSATGLGQILKATLKTFNKENGFAYTMTDMENPEKNAMVSAWLLAKIANTYAKYTKLKVDWSDPNFVGLVCLGYMAGWSEKEGVAHLVSTMEKAGVTKDRITPENVRLTAMKLYPSLAIYNNGGGYMSEPGLMKSTEARVRDYWLLRGLHPPQLDTAPVPLPTSASSAAAIDWHSLVKPVGIALGVAGVLALLAKLFGSKQTVGAR